MSKPRYPWYQYVRGMIYRYPSRSTEEESAAVEAALDNVRKMEDGETRMKLLNFVYFSKGKANKRDLLKWASYHVPCEYETAKRWNRAFVYDVARNFKTDGLLKE